LLYIYIVIDTVCWL